jgi:hypothetical protein
MTKKSPFISSSDFDKILAQRRKKFNEKKGKTLPEQHSKNVRKSIQQTLSNGAAKPSLIKKHDVILPEVIEYKTRRLPRKKDKEQLSFNTQQFGNIMLADQLSIKNKLTKEMNALALRRQEQQEFENLRLERQRQTENIRAQEYKNLDIIERKLAREEAKRELTSRQRAQDEADRFANNYQARDLTSHVTDYTATQRRYRPYSRNALRQEWVVPGPVSKFSGTPLLDIRLKNNFVSRGSLNIGNPISKGSLVTKGRIMPTLFDIAGSIGGDVVMPTGVLKIKGRRKI